jgi:putative flippase GtrA
VSTWQLPQFGRFLSVGAVNAVLGLLVIFGVKGLFQFGDVAANALGYGVGITVSFLLNSRWTFAHRGAQWPAFVRFVALALVAYTMNLLAVLLAIRVIGINGYVAQVIGLPVYTVTLYLASRHLVFRPERPAHGPR